MLTKQTCIRCAAVATVLALAAGANAGNWDTNLVVLHADVGNFKPGSKQTYLTNVVTLFNRNPSNFRLEQRFDLPSGAGRINNGRNEVFMSSKETAPAATYRVYDWLTGDIIEADVRIRTNPKVAWSYSYNKKDLLAFDDPNDDVFTTRCPLETMLLHEYGHVAGLEHENDVYNIMGEDWTHMHCNGNSARGYLGEDACQRLVEQYGRNSSLAIEDVSVSPFKRILPDNGAYSNHDFCVVVDSAGALAARDWDPTESQWRYGVTRGALYGFEFTFENNGETPQTPRIGFYLSTDNSIATNDRFLGSFSRTLTREADNVDTLTVFLWLPSDLVRGEKYFLGVMVDDNRRISEVDEQNAAYHMIQIN